MDFYYTFIIQGENMNGVLKDRIDRAILYRLVTTIAGNNVSNKWGSSIGSEGYKEAERILRSKYENIKLEDLHNEILKEFLFRVVADAERENKKRMTMGKVTEQTSEEKRKNYKDSCETYKAYKEESTLDYRLRRILENKEIEQSKKVIEESWKAIITGEEENINTIEEMKKIIESLDIIEKQKNTSNYNDIDLDMFIDKTLPEAINYIKSNTFKATNMNNSEKNIIKQSFKAKLNTLNSKNERSRVKDTIYDKINKGKVNTLSLYDFQRGIQEIIDMYKSVLTDKNPITNIYLIETQYSLALYIIVAFEIVGLGIKDKDIDGFLNKTQDIMNYSNCLDGYEAISYQINERYSEIDNNSGITKSTLNERLEYKFTIKEKVIRDMPIRYDNNTINLSDIKDTELIDETILDKIKVVEEKIELLEYSLKSNSLETDKILKVLKKMINNHSKILKSREDKIKYIIEI